MTTPLHKASWKGHTDAMQLLIELGTNVNERDQHGWTPLYWASHKHTDAIQLLKDHGAHK